MSHKNQIRRDLLYLTPVTSDNSTPNALETIEIDEETWKVARDYVAELNQPQRVNLKQQIRTLNGKIDREKKMQTDLGRKFAEGELPKNEYDRLMEDSHAKEASLRNTVIRCENITHELDELMYQFLDSVKYVTKKLKSASPINKREVVDIFCENLAWKDEKVRWDWKKPYFILAKQPKKSNVLPG